MKMIDKSTYKDFLQDDNFILWRFTAEESLNTYWEEFITTNPALREEFEKAIREFSKIQLNQESMTEVEYTQLLHRIRLSDSRIRQKKKVRLFIQYAAAACLALLIGLSIYYVNRDAEETILLSDNIIVGEKLDEEEIFLITDTETTSFSKDIHIQMDKNGSTIVQEVDGDKSTIVGKGKNTMNKLVIPYGKRSQLELADGTKVWLNSGSVLEFPSAFTGDIRKVNLTGEMYVEVVKDTHKPFIVNTPDFQVKVYGTTFNVSAYDDTQSVVLVEGSVGVKTTSNKETILMPNDMLAYRDNEWSKEQVDVIQYTSWKDGYILLNQTSISDVLKQVERYYNLSFTIDENIDLRAKTSTGKIYLSDNLDNTMKTISLLSSTEYRRENKTIYINVTPK